MTDKAARILDFLKLSERLKTELRHSWLSNGRHESVAEHTWQMALMALLTHRHLAVEIDLEKTLKMIVVHDLVEVEAGDVPSFATGEAMEQKAAREEAAIRSIREKLPDAVGEEIQELWQEYEAKLSNEAKFAGALDKLEVQVQHNLADMATWEPVEYDLVYTKMDGPCAFDPFLTAFCDAVKTQAETRMRAAGVDPEDIKRRVEAAKAP